MTTATLTAPGADHILTRYDVKPSAPAKGPALRDTFKDLGNGRAECRSKNGPTYPMRYTAFDGGRVVTACKCKHWGLHAQCRHGDQLQARLAAQDAAENLMLARYHGARYFTSAAQDSPCAECAGVVVSVKLWGHWDLPGGGKVRTYWPHVQIVCGCGVQDGGRVR